MESESNNDYLFGKFHAVLTENTVHADWGSDSNAALRVDAANRAFCIWYHGQKSLDDAIGEPHWDKMWKTMHECSKSGWGLGVSELRESFWHYASTGGQWTDDNTTTYNGKDGKAYKRRVTNMPEGPANFLKAVDERLPTLKTTLQKYQESCKAMSRIAPDTTSDLEKMGKHLGDIKTYAERAEKMMWMLPGAVQAKVPNTEAGWDAVRRVEEFADNATTWATRSVKILDVVGKITDGVKVYADASAALGGDRRAGLAFAGIHYAMNFVPVLGTFYGTFISKVPGLITAWTEFVSNYHNRLDRASRGLDYSRPQKPPAWKCKYCKSTGGY